MKEFLGVLRTKTIKHSLASLSGTFVNGGLGLIFYILIARFLGPYSFGIFSVAVASLTLTGDVSDLGISTGIVRFVPKYIGEEKEKALKILKLSLFLKLLAWMGVLIFGWLLVPFAVSLFFGKPELTTPLRISLVGVGGALLFSFSTSSIQALQKFWTWGVLNVGMNLVRLLITIAVFGIGYLSIINSLWIYSLIPFLGFFIGLLFIPNFFKVKDIFGVSKEIFSYNKWIAGFNVIAAISSRLDTFLTTRLLNLKDVGIYSVSVQLSGIVPQIVFALASVAAPKLATFDTKTKAITYLKKFQLLVCFLAALGLIIGIPLAYYVIPHFYGGEYQGSISPFVVLLIAQAIFLVSIPVHTAVIYYFSYPKLFVWISTIHFLIIGLFGYFLISTLGIMGASYTVLIGSVSNFVIPAVWVVKRFRER